MAITYEGKMVQHHSKGKDSTKWWNR